MRNLLGRLRDAASRADSLPRAHRVNAVLYALAVLGVGLITLEIRQSEPATRQVRSLPRPPADASRSPADNRGPVPTMPVVTVPPTTVADPAPVAPDSSPPADAAVAAGAEAVPATGGTAVAESVQVETSVIVSELTTGAPEPETGTLGGGGSESAPVFTILDPGPAPASLVPGPSPLPVLPALPGPAPLPGGSVIAPVRAPRQPVITPGAAASPVRPRVAEPAAPSGPMFAGTGPGGASGTPR